MKYRQCKYFSRPIKQGLKLNIYFQSHHGRRLSRNHSFISRWRFYGFFSQWRLSCNVSHGAFLEIQKHDQQYSYAKMAILLKESNQFIGYCGFEQWFWMVMKQLNWDFACSSMKGKRAILKRRQRACAKIFKRALLNRYWLFLRSIIFLRIIF